MQFAELMKLFREGQNEGRKLGYVTQGACDAEGIRAVIEAVMEVVCDNVYMTQECCGHGVPSHNNMHEECCGSPVHSITRDNLIMSFNEILATSEGGQAAGNDWTATTQPRLWAKTPAATAPVCEWRRTDESGYAHDHGWTGQFAFGHELPKCCHRCGLPIKFTEAQR